jgi:chromosome segregation ATPase
LTSKLDEISEAIGQLRAEVRGLGEQQKAANESRKAIYEKLEDVDGKVDEADAKIVAVDERLKNVDATMDKRLKNVEEPVAEFSRWRERGVGAVMLISFVAASVGGLLVTFGKKIWAVIVGT